jgi:hypothetical protein
MEPQLPDSRRPSRSIEWRVLSGSDWFAGGKNLRNTRIGEGIPRFIEGKIICGPGHLSSAFDVLSLTLVFGPGFMQIVVIACLTEAVAVSVEAP